MNRNRLLIVLVAFLLTVFGCATMIRGTRQSLQVMSDPPGATVEVSSGEKGTTPCTFLLQRNQSALLKFYKEGYHPESVSVYPTLAGAGVILGGLIDYGTGAVYNLTPNPVNVMLKPLETTQTIKRQESPPPKEKVKYEPAKTKPAATESLPTLEPKE